jgi:hypothetical protein
VAEKRPALEESAATSLFSVGYGASRPILARGLPIRRLLLRAAVLDEPISACLLTRGNVFQRRGNSILLVITHRALPFSFGSGGRTGPWRGARPSVDGRSAVRSIQYEWICGLARSACGYAEAIHG